VLKFVNVFSKTLGKQDRLGNSGDNIKKKKKKEVMWIVMAPHSLPTAVNHISPSVTCQQPQQFHLNDHHKMDISMKIM
jgi:hypothetical protein